MLISEFQSQFSMSKIIRIFLIFFFEDYKFRGTYQKFYLMKKCYSYTFNHLVDSYRNTISELAMGFRYVNLTLKLARGLIFGGEEISIPETRPIRKSYIYQSIRLPFDAEGDEKFLNVDVKASLRQYT